MTDTPDAAALDGPGRRDLRRRLRAERAAFVASADFAAAAESLGRELRLVVAALEPECLGLYCPLPGEFNAAQALAADLAASSTLLALPFARREGARMEFRRWDGAPPEAMDECGIGVSTGPQVEPDVVLVPCLGFSRDGHRLGYGGGYYDRWLAAHPHVTAIGVAWACGEIDRGAFDAAAHDVALAAIVTERGVVR